jgi:hypothetical protein
MISREAHPIKAAERRQLSKQRLAYVIQPKRAVIDRPYRRDLLSTHP